MSTEYPKVPGANFALSILKLILASHNQDLFASCAEAGGFSCQKNFSLASVQEGIRFVGANSYVVPQAWYQLGIVYRRIGDAQKAMATFQKLKDEESDDSQKALKRYEAQRNPNSAQPPPAPQNPQ
jgi:hypothetical protein